MSAIGDLGSNGFLSSARNEEKATSLYKIQSFLSESSFWKFGGKLAWRFFQKEFDDAIEAIEANCAQIDIGTFLGVEFSSDCFVGRSFRAHCKEIVVEILTKYSKLNF